MKFEALQICLVTVSIPNNEKAINISWHWGWSITWRWIFLIRWFNKWTFIKVERFPHCGIRWGDIRLWLGFILFNLLIQQRPRKHPTLCNSGHGRGIERRK